MKKSNFLFIGFKFLLAYALTALVTLSSAQEVCDLDGEGMPGPPVRPGVFSLNTPAAETARRSTAIDLTWTQSSNADAYRVFYRIDGAGSWSLGPTIGDGTSTSIPESATISGLSSNTSYDFYIEASNTCQYCAPNCLINMSERSSDILQNIKTAPAAPGIPADINSGIHEKKFFAQWNSTSGSSEYRLDVSTNNSFTSFLSGFQNRDVNNVTSFEVSSLTGGETYYYRVRAVNSNGSISSSSSVKKVVTLPAAPSTKVAEDIGQISFNARWFSTTADEGTIKYQLLIDDNDNMSSPLATLNVGTVLEKVVSLSDVSQLTPGKIYYYTVKATNNDSFTNALPQANERAVLLLPATPVLQPATDITRTSFAANWNAVTTSGGSLSYRLLIDDNSDLSTPVVMDVGNTTTRTITQDEFPELTAASTLYYKVLSTNNGSFTNAGIQQAAMTVNTLPEVPELLPATSITPQSFTANWVVAVGPGTMAYQLEIDDNIDFSSLLYSANVGDVTSKAITTEEIPSLLPGHLYYYRIRASNSGTFHNAETQATPQEVLTIPAIPADLLTSSITAETFIASWNAVVGASFYEIEVALDNAFTDLVDGYDPRVVTGTLEEGVSGLSPSTIYYWRVRAGNVSGISAPSLFKVVPMLASDGSNAFDVTIKKITFSPEYDAENNSISPEVNGHFFPLVVTLFYKPVTEREYRQEDFLIEDKGRLSQLSWMIEENWLDEIGVEFYLTVADAADQKKVSDRNFVLRKINGWTLPITQFGSTVKEYQIVSTPYVVNSSIEDLFEPVIGAYNPVDWRLVRYQEGKNVDYADGLSKTGMERGKGYWFLSKKEVNLSFAQGKTPDNALDKPFILHLEPGWNLIGNPYPFTLDWNEVLAQNGNPPGVGSLKVYDGASEGFLESNLLPVFSGGFVRADEAVDLVIPVTSKPVTGGRKSSGEFSGRSIDEPAWILPVTLVQGSRRNSLAGFGMHPEASMAKDKFDEISLPRFVNYLELNTKHGEHIMQDLMRDVVATKDNHTWNFNIEYNQDEPVLLTWNAEALRSSKSTLLLHDVDRNMLVDMKLENSWPVSRNNSAFRIYYNSSLPHAEGGFRLGAPYPNPVTDYVTIPYAFRNDGNEKFETVLKVSDVSGNPIATRKYHSEDEYGLQQLQWDCHNDDGNSVAPGMYLMHLNIRSSLSGEYTLHEKIIVR